MNSYSCDYIRLIPKFKLNTRVVVINPDRYHYKALGTLLKFHDYWGFYSVRFLDGSVDYVYEEDLCEPTSARLVKRKCASNGKVINEKRD